MDEANQSGGWRVLGWMYLYGIGTLLWLAPIALSFLQHDSYQDTGVSLLPFLLISRHATTCIVIGLLCVIGGTVIYAMEHELSNAFGYGIDAIFVMLFLLVTMLTYGHVTFTQLEDSYEQNGLSYYHISDLFGQEIVYECDGDWATSCDVVSRTSTFLWDGGF